MQSRTASLRLKLESLEQGLRQKRRRPEEEYRLENLASQSVHDRFLFDKRQGTAIPGLTMEASLKGSRVMEMPSVKRLETPHLMSLLNRQKRPLMNYELPRLDPRIRNLSNGVPQSTHHTSPPDSKRG